MHLQNDQSLTVVRLAPLIRRHEISPLELTRFMLERMERLQPQLNAFITITADLALSQARKATEEISSGSYRGPLHGIPISLKDLFDVRSIRTTAGSRILRNNRPTHNAKVVDRLLASGCVILGKTNLHEFAFGATSVNPHYGPVRNPWDPARISGGSSGGSAAAVAAGLCVASLGTDTGGSIRIPAAACGCVGLKPTHGLVPLNGVIPLAPSLDHVGPITRCVEDAATILEAISRDGAEAGKGRWKMPRGLRQGAAGLRIGIPKQYYFDRVRPDVRRAVLTAISVFQDAGAKLVEVDLHGMKETGELAAEITVAEALVYHWKWLQTRAGDYGDDLRTRMMEKLEMPAVAYLRYLERRQAYAERLARAIDACDVIACPTLPMPACFIRDTEVALGRSRETVRNALLRLTRPANLAGLPAISIPCGFSSEGLPVGLQLIGRRFGESMMLQAAWFFEHSTPWHTKFPPDPPGTEG
jgi:aspartyl-tRNA(Asn)/glutamyl-tRNA(Gln) amidotransferase subunit A